MIPEVLANELYINYFYLFNCHSQQYLKQLCSLTGLGARVATAAEVRTELRRRDPDMTEDEEKTAGLLCQALQARNCIWMEGLDTTDITTQIDNLCVN